MRLAIIACEILHREICHCIAQSRNVVDARFLRKGLHDVGQDEMSSTLRDEIRRLPKDRYDAILLGYGLCSNGISGLASEHSPLVVPRAHDCITLLLGSKERYRDFFDAHPGTYFRSTGWIERNTPEMGPDGKPRSIMTQLGFNHTLDELVARYGEDNARYIADTLAGWYGTKNYDTLAYIDMRIGDFPDHEEQAKQEALGKGWRFHGLQGDIGLLRRLVDAEWDPTEFLVLQPGQEIVPTYVGDIVRAGSP